MYLISGSFFIGLGIICYLVGRSILIGIRYKKHKQVYLLKEIIGFLFIVYIFMIVSVTLFPFPISSNYNVESVKFSINIKPLKSIVNDFKQIGVAYDGDVLFMIGLIARNVGGNILLLMPLGFLSTILWGRFKHFKSIILLGLCVSISIEIMQLLETFLGGFGRITDIDDVICNVLGVIIGYLICILFFKIGNKFQIDLMQKLIFMFQEICKILVPRNILKFLGVFYAKTIFNNRARFCKKDQRSFSLNGHLIRS